MPESVKWQMHNEKLIAFLKEHISFVWIADASKENRTLFTNYFLTQIDKAISPIIHLDSTQDLKNVVHHITDMFSIPVRAANVDINRQLQGQIDILKQSGQQAIILIQEPEKISNEMLSTLIDLSIYQAEKPALFFVFFGNPATEKKIKIQAKKRPDFLYQSLYLSCADLNNVPEKTERSWRDFLMSHKIKLASVALLMIIASVFWYVQHSKKPVVTIVAHKQKQAVSVQSLSVIKALTHGVLELKKSIKHGWGTYIEKTEKKKISSSRRPKTAAQLLLAQKGYTIQLMGGYTLQQVTPFVVKNNLEKKVIALPTYHKGKPWYILFYGEFESFDTAQTALKLLPKSVQAAKPWIRPFTAVHKIIRENHV